jgi:hypothetical protein
MDRPTRVALASLALGAVLEACGMQPVIAQALTHPGTVVEMGSPRRPLAVDVKAWPESTESGRQGDCPLYGTAPLDSTRSKPNDGQFTLRVEAKKSTYTTPVEAK